ncbi:hypothetical protein AK812_SmicGene39629 [Symbiodinium microadriaticum]|uniref:Uncharacterized protein n=1 Tax=Symbiodinium microadriaticum TaxID=2951 RepID=A0A1Q9CAP8_SYMMI|nr:hypothetical protein AK812_SmicGene39629 [Symbiodinium microadriaticum]
MARAEGPGSSGGLLQSVLHASPPRPRGNATKRHLFTDVKKVETTRLPRWMSMQMPLLSMAVDTEALEARAVRFKLFLHIERASGASCSKMLRKRWWRPMAMAVSSAAVRRQKKDNAHSSHGTAPGCGVAHLLRELPCPEASGLAEGVKPLSTGMPPDALRLRTVLRQRLRQKSVSETLAHQGAAKEDSMWLRTRLQQQNTPCGERFRWHGAEAGCVSHRDTMSQATAQTGEARHIALQRTDAESHGHQRTNMHHRSLILQGVELLAKCCQAGNKHRLTSATDKLRCRRRGRRAAHHSGPAPEANCLQIQFVDAFGLSRLVAPPVAPSNEELYNAQSHVEDAATQSQRLDPSSSLVSLSKK